MPRNILLVEPAYNTKFPPLGLMKISAYHKSLGDNVVFAKGKKIGDGSFEFIFWDRIYITTLFTYTWKITIDTINYYKKEIQHGDISRILVGGIMASLMAKEIWQETGIVPIEGVLNKPGILGDDNKCIIDKCIPDYNLFKGLPYDYKLLDSYFGYSTRGCVNKCKFCGVHKLEPKFIEYKGLKPYVNKIIKLYGEKQDLVLFDNNILASSKFEKIINDIMDLGFKKGDKLNNRLRRVDFNQGTDARLMKEKHVKLIAKLAINPLRIAFDHIREKKIYSKNIELAAKHGIRNLSNYILYNFKDTPEDLWDRLDINIKFNKNLNLSIYSFPMKYMPLDAKDRSYINSPNWNWLFLRNVQRILHVLKGSVMTSEDFFKRAFGENKEEFKKILYMPEKILMYRGKEEKAAEKEWSRKFDKLTNDQKNQLLTTLCSNRSRKDLKRAYTKLKDGKIKKMLEYYQTEEKVADDSLPILNKIKSKGK